MTKGSPGRADDLMARAAGAIQRGELEKARALLEQLLSQDPGHGQAHHMMGVLDLQTGKAADAVVHLRVATRLLADVSAGINLAIALARAGEAAEAQAVLTPLATGNPDNAQAAFNLGHLLAQTGQAREAEPWLRRATVLEPGYLSAWSDLGVLLIDDNRLDDAATCFGRVLALDPGQLPARFNRALIDHRQGRFAEAVQGFEACRAGMGSSRGFVLGLGASLQELGRIEEALSLYRVLLKTDPGAYLSVLKNLTGCARGLSASRPSALRALLGMGQLRDR